MASGNRGRFRWGDRSGFLCSRLSGHYQRPAGRRGLTMRHRSHGVIPASLLGLCPRTPAGRLRGQGNAVADRLKEFVRLGSSACSRALLLHAFLELTIIVVCL
jgi:hypothetical protein